MTPIVNVPSVGWNHFYLASLKIERMSSVQSSTLFLTKTLAIWKVLSFTGAHSIGKCISGTLLCKLINLWEWSNQIVEIVSYQMVSYERSWIEETKCRCFKTISIASYGRWTFLHQSWLLLRNRIVWRADEDLGWR